MADQPRAVKGLRQALNTGIEKAISVPQPAATAHIQRIRRRRPEATPTELIAALEKQYLATVTGSGAAVGGAAAAPGVGTGLSLAISAGETATFLAATALFMLAVAEIHGVDVHDLERRRTLLLAVLLGDSGPKLIEKIAGRTGKHWGKLLTDAIPMSSITSINKALGRHFMTKYGTKQGILVIGRAAPFGIGMGIGAAGNAVVGRSVIAGTRRAFGPPPASFHSAGFEGATL